MGGKLPTVLLEELASEIATQGLAGVLFMLLLALGTLEGMLLEPRLEIELDELVFETAGAKLLIDGEELVAQEAVIDIAGQGGQSWGQGELEGDDFGVHES